VKEGVRYDELRERKRKAGARGRYEESIKLVAISVLAYCHADNLQQRRWRFDNGNAAGHSRCMGQFNMGQCNMGALEKREVTVGYFNKNRFSLRQVVVLLALAFSGLALLSYGAITIPNSFTPGSTISSSEMNVNFGAVKTAIDSLQNVRTGYVSVAAVAAGAQHPASTSTDIANIGGSQGRYMTAGVSDSLVAPVQLPHGATITQVTYVCYDNDATYSSNAYLVHVANTNYSIVASVSTAGQDPNNQVISSGALSIAVDNSVDAYYVLMQMYTGAGTNLIPVRFIIQYTYTL
jgi:hypothetical protein